MNKIKKSEDNRPKRKPKSNSFGDLVQSAIRDGTEAEKAYRQLRTTYLKEVKLKDKPRKLYWKIFPRSILRVEERPFNHQVEGERERTRDFRFSVNAQARNFVRNLWFAHQFFSKPAEVERFLGPSTRSERQKLFQCRSDELQTLAGTYLRWSSTAEQMRQQLENFDPEDSDLLSFLEDVKGPGAATAKSPASVGSAAVADLIREVEQRASYKAGNPEDACEKALYFYALGRPDIGQAIAREVLEENPGHAVALYANAVFLLNASERHQHQALIHDIMHPHDLTPIEPEEFFHAERHVEESLRAEEKAAQAFLLMLKARQNWPKKFLIKCYELAPAAWLDKVDEWLMRQAVARLAADPRSLAFSNAKDAHTGRESLKLIIPLILSLRGRALFVASAADFLRRLVIVAAHVHSDRAVDCISGLEAALEGRKSGDSRWRWEYYHMDLPVSADPTFAASLIPAATDPRFCQAVFAVKPEADAINLLAWIMEIGMKDERDRVVTIWSLKVRDSLLNITRGAGMDRAVEICLEMQQRHDWPDSETGKKLQCSWLYGAVMLLFESSRVAFETSDLAKAVKQAVRAIRLAVDSLPTIAHDLPLFKFYVEDEDGVFEDMGDFFYRQPNIVTDVKGSDYCLVPMNSYPFPGSENPCWNDFTEWSCSGPSEGKPVLLAYGLWLWEKWVQDIDLRHACDDLAESLDRLP
jgi:hypothetical protein